MFSAVVSTESEVEKTESGQQRIEPGTARASRRIHPMQHNNPLRPSQSNPPHAGTAEIMILRLNALISRYCLLSRRADINHCSFVVIKGLSPSLLELL